jgi:hypothetical protein
MTMANRRAMKLFAATLLAGAAPAAADPAPRVTHAVPGPRVMGIDWKGNIDIVAIKPVELANGRAAMGNVRRRPGLRDLAISRTRQQLEDASRAYQDANAIVIVPRLLGSFRPACGNTGGKVGSGVDCSPSELRAARAYDKAHERLAEERHQTISAAWRKLRSATEAAVRADPSLEARLYVDGQPACGKNKMNKRTRLRFCRD